MIRKDLEKEQADVKWVEYENYHITLKFLGDINMQQAAQVRKRLDLAALTCPSFQVHIQNMGFFPNQRRPRVIWLGMVGEMQQAEFLGERIDTYLSEMGYEPEGKRSFHLTLGRIRSDRNVKEMMQRALPQVNRVHSRDFEVAEFHFMESKLSPQGPTYSINQVFRLRG